MFAQQISCIIIIASILARVNGFTNIPNSDHRHNVVSAGPNMHHKHDIVPDPRTEALNHRIAMLQKTLNELQKQRLHSRPRPLIPQPAPLIRRMHPHLTVRSQPLNYQIVGSPFTSDLLDRVPPRPIGPETPFEFYTAFVPAPSLYE